MGVKIIIKNKRARFDYHLVETLEAGMSLVGTEVKSLRLGKASMAESHITIDKNKEIWIHNMTISHYEFGNIANHQETRKRKLLLHKAEIERLYHKVRAEGYTIVPVSLYFKASKIKLEIALAKGKKLHDKRQAEAEKDAKKRARESLKNFHS